jgi:uncharacterized membrane protein
MAKYRYAVGFWLSLAAVAWTLMAIGAGLNAIANNGKYVNDVMITTLVLLAGVTVLLIRLALRLRRHTRRFANPS